MLGAVFAMAFGFFAGCLRPLVSIDVENFFTSPFCSSSFLTFATVGGLMTFTWSAIRRLLISG